MKSVCILFVVALVGSVYGADGKLGSYNVNIDETTVSGLSAGAFFAVQMHVAFSSDIQGAGVFAGGPYHCAEGQMATALTTCMNPWLPLKPSTYVDWTDIISGKSIDDKSNLATDRVYLFSGTDDTTVHPPVMKALQTYYKDLLVNGSVEVNFSLKAAHTQPTDDPNNVNACTTSSSPYLSNCNFDGAGAALQHIFSNTLKPRTKLGSTTGSLIKFDQTEFLSGKGFDTSGWAYVPKSCENQEACKLHVSFHGCEQGQHYVGMDYVSHSGYNLWADSNNMIVLYPQVVPSYWSPTNPQGCFDWWGYNSAYTYDTKDGAQMKAVYAMMERISASKNSTLF